MSNTSTGIAGTCVHGVVHAKGLMMCSLCYPPTPVGWMCPKCGTIYAPSIIKCERCAP